LQIFQRRSTQHGILCTMAYIWSNRRTRFRFIAEHTKARQSGEKLWVSAILYYHYLVVRFRHSFTPDLNFSDGTNSLTCRFVSDIATLIYHDHIPSVNLAFPPLGWHKTVAHDPQCATVCACENTVVMAKQPDKPDLMLAEQIEETRMPIHQIYYLDI
jgi:hypothetical protein